MNNIFKVIWHYATQSWVVTSELTKARGKIAVRQCPSVNINSVRHTTFSFTLAASVVLIAIGQVAYGAEVKGSDANNAIKAGKNACFYDTASQSVVCGDDTTYTIDKTSDGKTAKSVVLGREAVNTGESNVAIGLKASSAATASVAIGNAAAAKAEQAVAIGQNASANYKWDIAIGRNTLKDATGPEEGRNIAIGDGALKDGKLLNNNTAIGTDAGSSLTGTFNVAIGTYANSKTANQEILKKDEGITAKETVALGNRSLATKDSAVSIGNRSQATNLSATAIGTSSKATGQYAVAQGANAKAEGTSSVAIGGGTDTKSAKATHHFSTAVGYNSISSGRNATALGSTTNAEGLGSTALGSGANTTRGTAGGTTVATGAIAISATTDNEATQKTTASGNQSIAIGVSATASAQNAIAQGMSATASNQNAIALGRTTQALGQNSIAQGVNAKVDANGTNAIAIGVRANNNGVETTGNSSVALGTDTNAASNKAVAIGANAKVQADTTTPADPQVGETNAQNGIAIGSDAKTSGTNALSIGQASSAKGQNSTAVGNDSHADGKSSLALGDGSDATKNSATAVGAYAQATGEATLALGLNSNSTALRSIAIGADAKSEQDSNIAIGNSAKAQTGTATVAIGKNAEVTANSAVALGNEAKAEVENGVALGFNSLANIAAGAVGVDPLSVVVNRANSVWTATHAAVSVGNGTAITRQITSVAAGTNDTDAVNVAQLKAAGFVLNTSNSDGELGTKTVGTTKDTDDKIQNGETLTIDAGKNIKVTQTGGKVSIATKDDVDFNSVTSNDVTVNTGGSLVLGSDVMVEMGDNVVTGVADGEVSANSSDAVNGSQLYATNTNIATYLGGGAKMENGQMTAPTYTIKKADGATAYNTTPANNVGDALTQLNSYVNEGFKILNNAGTQKAKVQPQDQVQFVNGKGTTSAVTQEADGLTKVQYDVAIDDKTIKVDADGKLYATVKDTNSVTKLANGSTTTVTSKTNGDETTYTVEVNKAQVNTTPTDTADADKITINTAGKVVKPTDNTKAGNSFVTADVLADVVNSTGFNIQANGDTKSLVKAGDTVQFKDGDNIEITRTGNDITVATAKDVSFDSVKVGDDITLDSVGVKVGDVNITTGGIDMGGHQITNVADGTVSKDSKDAINGSQLFAQGEGVKNIIGGDTTYDPATGTYTNADIGGTGKNNINDAIKASKTTVSSADSSIKVTKTTNGTTGADNYDVSVNAQAISENAQLPVVYTKADGTKVYKVGGKFFDNKAGTGVEIPATDVIASMQNADGTISPTTLANVKAGVKANDAVNVSQLSPLAVALGTTVANDGTVKAPSFIVTKTDGSKYNGATTVQGALDNIGTEIQKPLTFAGDSGTNIERKLGTQVNVKGGVTDSSKLTDNNIGVVSNGTDTLTVKLAKDVDLGNNGSLKAGNTSLNNEGVKVGDVVLTNNGLTAGDVSLTKDGINAGNKVITGVAAGDISPTSTQAVNGAQIFALTGGKNNTNVGNYTVTNPNGTTTYQNVVLDENNKPALVTYNVSGQSEYITNSVVTAIKNMNEQGIKFFHTNDGLAVPTEQDHNTIDSSASGKYATAVGYKAAASGENAIAFGNGAQANAKNTISIGNGNIVNGENSGAFGDPTTINAKNSYSVGNNNELAVGQSDVFALGNDIKETTSNSVFLGSKSGSFEQAGSTKAANGVHKKTAKSNYTYRGENDANVAGVENAVGVVSVGNATETRQIQGVAAGVVSETSTDAINGSQLYYTNKAIGDVKNDINKLGDVVNKNNRQLRAGIAGANAAAGLPQVYLPGKSMVAASAGTFKGEGALAVGYSRASDNGKVILKLQGNANTRGGVGGSVGVGYQW